MTQNNSTKMLRLALLISAIVSLVYGLGFFLIPGILVTISKGNPVDFGWLRWPGGILISLGIGALLASRNVAKQGVFVTTLSLGYLFAGLGLLYSWLLNEYSAATWFIAVPTIVVLVVSALLWWGRQGAKDIL